MADQDDCDHGFRYVAELYARQLAGITMAEHLGQIEQAARGCDQPKLGDDGQPLYTPDPITGDPVPVMEHVPADATQLDRWQKYRAALNIVYPCPRCRPDQFERWRHGCFRPNHAAKACKLCNPKVGERR